MFLLHSSFHTKFESRFLQIDHQIKLSCRSFFLQLALHNQPQNAEAAEVKVTITPNVKVHPPNWGFIEKRPVSTEKKMKLCWGQLGSSAQGMKNHWTSFSAAKKGSHWNFSHGIKTSVYMVFGLSWKKKTTFFWRATKHFCVPSKIFPSSPVRSGVDRTTFDVTWPTSATPAPDFDVSLWDSSLSSAQLEDKVRPPDESPRLPPQCPPTPTLNMTIAGKIPHVQ